MKDQVLRILKMVQEGKLTPDDAYDLMDAFVSFESSSESVSGAQSPPPPPPPPNPPDGEDPFRRFVDSVEKMTKEAVGSVDWSRVADQVRTATKKGVVAVRESVDQISKGEFRFTWFGPTESKTVELPLNISTGKTLRLELTSGDVDIKGGFDTGKLTATAKVRGKDREEAQAKAEMWTPVIEEAEGVITVRQSGDVQQEDLEIKVPVGVNLDIRVESGDVRCKDTRGSLRLEGKSGDIDVEHLVGGIEISNFAGDVKVQNSEAPMVEIENKSGDVTLVAVKGNLTVRSASGDVSGKQLASGAVSVETVSGDIDLDLSEPVSGTVNVRTVSGDVLLDLASGSNCRVSLSSLNGSVGSRIDLADEKRTEERITGVIGTGDGVLDASAVSGDVRLSWRDHQ